MHVRMVLETLRHNKLLRMITGLMRVPAGPGPAAPAALRMSVTIGFF